jgi:phage terminase large subunit
MEISFKLTITAKRTRKAIEQGFPVIVNTGGSRSGKTYGVMQNLILLCLEKPGLRVSVVSRSLPHIKKGAFRDFQHIMSGAMLQTGEMKWTDFVFTFHNGSYIEFIGLEDPDKAHGPGRDILFINEANFVPLSVYRQLAMRTTGQILLDLNPSEFSSWVYNLADDPKNKSIHSTYNDNRENLSQSQIDFIESYKSLPDPFHWEVYGLGKRGAPEELIYKYWRYCDTLPGKGDLFFGLDFGFTNPTALVAVECYDGEYYCKELLYQSNLTKPELSARLIELLPKKGLIYADSAEPDSIEELYRQGFNIKPSNKDVWNGIMTIKGSVMHVTRDSSNLVKELLNYRWKKDKNEVIQEEPVKDLDHILDALRYAIHTHKTQPRITMWSIYD